MKKNDDKGNQIGVEILFGFVTMHDQDKAIKKVLPGLLEPGVYNIV